MKKTSLLFLSLFFIFLTFGKVLGQTKTLPNSFSLQGDFDKSQMSFYENAINNSNLEIYRLIKERTKITFSNGFILELFSAEELLQSHIILSTVNYQEISSIIDTKPEFRVLDSGVIVVRFKTKESKF